MTEESLAVANKILSEIKKTKSELDRFTSIKKPLVITSSHYDDGRAYHDSGYGFSLEKKFQDVIRRVIISELEAKIFKLKKELELL